MTCFHGNLGISEYILDLSNNSAEKLHFFFVCLFNGRYLSQRPLPTSKAGSDDYFIMEALNRQSPLPPYEGTDSFTPMPYSGFELCTFGVAVSSPIQYTNWSAIYFLTIVIMYLMSTSLSCTEYQNVTAYCHCK